jgi:hypothetical protein
MSLIGCGGAGETVDWPPEERVEDAFEEVCAPSGRATATASNTTDHAREADAALAVFLIGPAMGPIVFAELYDAGRRQTG